MPGLPVTHTGQLTEGRGPHMCNPCNAINQTRRVPISRHTPDRFVWIYFNRWSVPKNLNILHPPSIRLATFSV